VPNHAAVYGEFQDDVTAQAILSGAVSFTYVDTSVIGTGTAFLSEIAVNEFIRPEDETRDDKFERVTSIASNTHLEMHRLWQNTNYSGSAELGYRDGRAERPFIDTTERVRRFLEGIGVTVRYGYGHHEGPSPAFFKNGDPLPPELLTYAWDANFEDVRDNWRQGLDGIILHRDHGNRSGWSTPAIGAGALAAMDDPENAFYPFVLSINCQSGWFDNEVDVVRTDTGYEDDWRTNYGTESFCEYVLRMPDAGAVAIYGASRNSQSGPNDLLVDGIMKSFYPDYMPGALLPVWGNFSHPLAGDACRYAQTYVALNRDSERKSLYYLQLYHLFGCPLTEVRLPTAP
jgi:hypothetical protein